MQLKVIIDPIGYGNEGAFVNNIASKKFIKTYKSFIKALLDRPRIAHFNWINYTGIIKFIRFLTKILIYKLFNIKIVWTVHNVLPHKVYNYKMTIVQRKILALAANRLTFFSKNDFRVFSRLIKLNLSKKSNIIELGPTPFEIPYISRSEARKLLGFTNSEYIIVYYGKIMAYKGVDQLIMTTSHIQKNLDLPVRLVIIGRCKDPKLRKKIENNIKLVENVNWIQEFLEERTLSQYIIAANINAMTFTQISMSETFCLGKRFPTKIVAPHSGSLPEHDSLGIPAAFYKINDINSLENVLENALKESEPTMNFIKEDEVKKRWEVILKKVWSVYLELF